VSVIVRNQGSAAASGVYVYAGFDAGDNLLWNPEKSMQFDLEVGQEVTVTLNLTVPSGKHTRLIVQIVDDGVSVDDSCSEWFDS
jgi:queuine/archaeosine tRNA-ribosyltransferase